MDPVTRAILVSWSWRPEVGLPLLTLGALFVVGWRRLRRLDRAGRPHPQLGQRWRLISYGAGLLALVLALLSPIDLLSGQLFFMHMIQHMLLVMVAPPLLWLANPMPVLVWGLPLRLRRLAGRQLFGQHASLRRWLTPLTRPVGVWLVYFFILWGWHDPGAYNAALRDDLVHDLEHLTFFGSAMLLWWHIIGAGPRWHKRFSYLGRTAYSLASVPGNMILGVAIALAETPIYTYYLSVPRVWAVSVLTDQQISGIIMWIPGSMMHLIAAIVLIARWQQQEGRMVEPTVTPAGRPRLSPG